MGNGKQHKKNSNGARQTNISGERTSTRSRSQQNEDPDCTVFFYAKQEVRQPCCMCCSLCLILLIFIVVLAVATAGGAEIIRFTTDVPFYLYDSTVYKRQTHLFSAYDVANANLEGDLREREQIDFNLQIIYELDGPDALFSPEVLARIKGLEEVIVADEEYTDFCALNYNFDALNPVCVRHSSPVNFFDRAWWLPATNPPPQPTVPSTFNAEYLIRGSTYYEQDEVGYYPFANPQDSSAVGTVDLTRDNVDTILAYWAGYCSSSTNCPDAANGDSSPYALTTDLGTNVTLTSPLLDHVDTSFGINGNEVNPNAIALQSEFYFGTPQRRDDSEELYDVDTDSVEEQREELGKFLFDAYDDILSKGLEGVNVYWTGDINGMLDVYINSILFNDILLLLPTFLFVLVYLVVQLRSWWLGGVGILMILGNFGPALLLYRAFAGYSYFGLLNALVIFVILGIGADDIFVFSDTWKRIRRTMPDSPVEVQLVETLRFAGKAMAVTSLTTTASFLTNALSEFPAVQSFGIFSAMLIITNYFSVVILFPAVTMVYEYYMHEPSKSKGLCRSTFHGCCKKAGYPDASLGEMQEKGLVIKFFENWYYPFLRQFKVIILILYLAIVVFYVVVATQLKPDSESPSFLPEDDNYMIAPSKVEDYFSQSDVSNRVIVEIPFGIIGTDRGDCDGSSCDKTVETDYGAPIWDSAIEGLSNVYAQKWMLDFCNAMESADDASTARMVYPADASNPTPVTCVHEALQIWCQEESGRCSQTNQDLPSDDYIVDAAVFFDTLFIFLESDVSVSDPNYQPGQTNYDLWKDHVRIEDLDEGVTGDNTVLRYISVQALLTATGELDFEDGINLYQDWEEFVDLWLDLSADTSIYGTDTEETVASAFVTDRGFFHYYYLQDAIIDEAFRGIGIALGFAFIILCIATRNWIVSMIAIITVGSLVGGVVTFTVLMGWKLGILEAVLFVMVVGLSVDYTIHLADAYLESKGETREDRTKDMLSIMGVSVVSGAFSTIGACVSLLFAYFTFFLKFGTVILFIIAQSLVFSLLFFSAMMITLGPEIPRFGENIRKGRKVLIRRSSSSFSLREGRVMGVQGREKKCKVLLDENRKSLWRAAGEHTEVLITNCRLKNQRGSITCFGRCC